MKEQSYNTIWCVVVNDEVVFTGTSMSVMANYDWWIKELREGTIMICYFKENQWYIYRTATIITKLSAA